MNNLIKLHWVRSSFLLLRGPINKSTFSKCIQELTFLMKTLRDSAYFQLRCDNLFYIVGHFGLDF